MKSTPERIEYQKLHHDADQKDPDGCAQHFGDKEEPCPGFVGGYSETLLEVFVDRDQLHPVEERNQHEGDDELSDDKTQHHLQVRKVVDFDPPRHRNEGYARNARSDHGQSYDEPRRFAVSDEESLIVGLSSGEIGNRE